MSNHERRDGANMDFDTAIEQKGQECAKLYLVMEDCLAKHQRDWRHCQKELHAWKDCFDQALKKNT